MPRVLTIEDDAVTGQEIVAELTSHGLDVEWADNGREGLAKAIAGGYDLITVDRMLPEVDGLTIVTTLRSLKIATPILMISALSDVDERVRGLRAGGDDYLTKPFASDEMAARVEVLLRRNSVPMTQTRLQVADLELDLISHEARRGEQTLNLLPTEYKLQFGLEPRFEALPKTGKSPNTPDGVMDKVITSHPQRVNILSSSD